jgi:hypothetical protein
MISTLPDCVGLRKARIAELFFREAHPTTPWKITENRATGRAIRGKEAGT